MANDAHPIVVLHLEPLRGFIRRAVVDDDNLDVHVFLPES
jgi:hypothetical protein